MAILDNSKKIVEKFTGWRRPTNADLDRLVRARQANMFYFRDDGLIPNHPLWPLIVYRGAIQLPESFDPAAVFEDVFARNGWERSWRNGIYDYAHYHSQIHEVLGIARGTGKVRFGGQRGRTIALRVGDVAVLPAGTGHQGLTLSEDFLVVGAYPPEGRYDECTASEDHARARSMIPEVTKPQKDPVYGEHGPLTNSWKSR